MSETTPTPEAPASTSAPAAAPTAAPAANPTNGLAIAALIVGIIAFLSGWSPFFGVVVGVAAIVLGALALKKAGGKGLAITGLITGGIGALWSIVVTIVFIIALAAGAASINVVQEAANQVANENKDLIESKKDFAKGETAQFGTDFEVKVNAVEANFAPGQYYEAASGKQYVRVNVTVKNISDKSQYVSAYTFSMLDNGIAVLSSYTPLESTITSGDLAKGASTTGDIVYEVTKDAQDLKLVYKTFAAGKDFKMQELNFSLAL